MSSATLLADIRSRLVVDVDSMDPDVAARHTNIAAKFCDMTSNQAIVYGEATRPERAELFKKACDHIRSTNAELDIDTQVSNAIDLLTVLLAKEVYPYLTGRVHAQASPSTAYDTEATINHARKLISVFEANGIPKTRVCIKIPATPESVALAAHQAGCLYIAPYFNELRVHFVPGVWKEYTDTAKEHPASPVIASIVKLYKEIDTKTLVMPASIVTAKEVVALVTLGPDHLTLSGAVLNQLAAAKGSEVSLEAEASVGVAVEPEVKSADYLANGGAALKSAIAADAETSRKLEDALKIFGEQEDKTKDLIRAALMA
ncbi:aldolase [Epithele typhae]|uniref:aldolase n=1 Tax=Epithele typhae TaxID=378194 RepID=UPI00200890D0|nr:aldolase [Epithele typhae]KAH9944381.1 aldolase [Epithele typhae]